MNKKMGLGILGSAILSVSWQANASDASKYYTIKSIKTEEVASEKLNVHPLRLLLPLANNEGVTTNSGAVVTDAGGLNIAGIDIDTVINLGKEAWDVIVANKPVVNVADVSANALPRGVQSWDALENWQAPMVKVYHTTIMNGLNMQVVDLTYRVHYTHGGSLNGVGKYLTNVSVEPANLDVAWGYKFGMSASATNITNVGSAENPDAAAELLLKWQIDTVVTHIENSASYYMRGDGEFEDLSAGN